MKIIKAIFALIKRKVGIYSPSLGTDEEFLKELKIHQEYYEAHEKDSV